MSQTLRLSSVLLINLSVVSCGGRIPAHPDDNSDRIESAVAAEGESRAASTSADCCSANYGLSSTVDGAETDDGVFEIVVEGGYTFGDENSGAVVLFVDNVERESDVARFGKHSYKLRFVTREQGAHPWRVELRSSDSTQKKVIRGIIVMGETSPHVMPAKEQPTAGKLEP